MAPALTPNPSPSPSPTSSPTPNPNPKQVSAMAALQRRRDFHMVILDVVLPGVHGDDLLPMIR